MKKLKKIIPILFVLLLVSCEKENESTTNTMKQTESSYEQLTNQYLVSIQEEDTFNSYSTRGFWGKLWKKVKKIAHKDANGGLNGLSTGNLKGALWGAVAASVMEIFQPSDYSEVDDITTGISDLAILKEVGFSKNTFDLAGYNHYVVINNILNDMTNFKVITDPEQQYIALKDTILKELSILYPTQDFDSSIDIRILNQTLELQEGESYTEGNAYYRRVFPLKDNISDLKFIEISQLYERAYEATKEEDLDSFITYSTTMETQIMNDADLASTMRDALLFKMATLRYGIKYYTLLP
ncbi:hypothetical protein [Myroides odoratus]|uniref:hypothetical protein n=1 Tax=Myroides odoratus TaxID=256 RepID=UPI0033421833